jgi:hypothetical protein
MRLRNPLLLALRILGLLLVIAAFAWPFLPSAQTTQSSESQVLILDSTLSNRAAGRWDEARDSVIRVLRKAPLTTQIAVIDLRATPHIVADWNLPRSAAIAEVEKLAPTHQRGSYAAAFRLAESLLGRALGKEHRITLLGDSQRNQWSEESQSVSFLSSAKIDLPAITEPALPNIAIFAPQLQRVFLGDRLRVECTVRLARQGPLNEAELSINVPGQYSDRRLVKFPDDEQLLQLNLAWEAPPVIHSPKTIACSLAFRPCGQGECFCWQVRPIYARPYHPMSCRVVGRPRFATSLPGRTWRMTRVMIRPPMHSPTRSSSKVTI